MRAPTARLDPRFGEPDAEATVRQRFFSTEPSKILAFAKDPHAQTAYRFG